MKKLPFHGLFKGKIAAWLHKKSRRRCSKTETEALKTDTLLKMEAWTREKKWIEECSMHQISQELGIRQEQLSLFFHQYIGKKFLQWRKELRVEEAKRIMQEDASLPTVIVGEAVGIPDKSNFRRQFKEITGLTPAQWKSEHKVHVR